MQLRNNIQSVLLAPDSAGTAATDYGHPRPDPGEERSGRHAGGHHLEDKPPAFRSEAEEEKKIQKGRFNRQLPALSRKRKPTACHLGTVQQTMQVLTHILQICLGSEESKK